MHDGFVKSEGSHERSCPLCARYQRAGHADHCTYKLMQDQIKSLKKRVRRIKTHIPKDDIFCDTELGELLDLRVPLR